jgi:hypothetical protein
MFYSGRMDTSLLLGDVIKGYILTPTTFFKPNMEVTHLKNSGLSELPVFSVVLTLQHQAEGNLLCLAPLVPPDSSFCASMSSYFGSAFTEINHVTDPETSFPSKSDDVIQRQREAVSPMTHAFSKYFIYEQHDLLPKYSLGKTQAGWYKIDFSNITAVKCKPDEYAKQESELLQSKCLQLSDSMREELNRKLLLYFKK